jgi:hypothetical protein
MKVLADENRLKLLGILANGERSVEELAALLQLKAPTVSHHLAKLREFDLVGMRSDKNTHYYWLNPDGLRQTNKLLLTRTKIASLVENVEGDAWERKVLRDYFEGTRLKEIPASPKKRSVILKWLANQFEYGVYYKEAEVNALIQRYHEDSAFLRRELISLVGYMQRDKGVYWRVSPELLDKEKRLLLLQELVELFEPRRLYTETEVNELLRMKSPDYPFLRQELVAREMLFSGTSGLWRNA